MSETLNDYVVQTDEKKLNLIFKKILLLEKDNSRTNQYKDTEMIDEIKKIIKEEVDRKC